MRDKRETEAERLTDRQAGRQTDRYRQPRREWRANTETHERGRGIKKTDFEIETDRQRVSNTQRHDERLCVISGVGYCTLLFAALEAVYYNVILAWVGYYLFSSFSSQLPWTHCNSSWNTAKCVSSNSVEIHVGAWFQRVL